MANFAYTHAKALLAKGDIDFDVDDIRVLLVMSNTSADTDEDVDNIAAIGTLDECDDTGYSRQALTGETVAEDEANDRAEFDADDVTFANNGDASRNVAGMIVYQHNTSDSDAVPIFWIDDDFPFALNGLNLVIQWNAEGIGQIT